MIEINSEMEADDKAADRGHQAELGPSDVETCIRKSGFKHHGVPKSEEEDKPQARFGTLLHYGWTEIIRRLKDPDRRGNVWVEIPGLRKGGYSDDVDWGRHIVNDLKTASDRAWTHAVTFGPREEQWDQVELYAYGLWLIAQQDPPDDGTEWHPPAPWTLALTLLNRENGREARFEQPADPERGAWLANWLAERQDAIEASTTPYDLPREGHGPGAGFPCDWCPWVGVCWPEAQGDLSPQAVTIADDPTLIEAVAVQYMAAQAENAKLEKAMKEARVYLQGIPGGDYGEARLKWQGGRLKDPEPDPTRMEQALRDNNLPVPTKRSRTARSLRISRVPETERRPLEGR